MCYRKNTYFEGKNSKNNDMKIWGQVCVIQENGNAVTILCLLLPSSTLPLSISFTLKK